MSHSLEVGQIAESIAHKINNCDPYFGQQNIEPRICFTAALLHDIGHPPFGHNGEEALDEKMRARGGFEGNAQTLRIVTQVEKKRHNPDESCPVLRRAGLNLTYRTLAAVLKYDSPMPEDRSGEAAVFKGYYLEDDPVVEDIKRHVAPDWKRSDKGFKTIECSIMDLADDIAYSTYDLEDSFKAGFLTPTKLLSSDVALLTKVAKQVGKRLEDPSFSPADVLGVFSDMFRDYVADSSYERLELQGASQDEKIVAAMSLLTELENIATEGEIRTSFTAGLVGDFVEAVEVDFNEEFPQLSAVKVDPKVKQKIEVLKIYTYEAIIASNRVKLAEYRGKEVVAAIFDALTEEKGYLLLPHDVAKLHSAIGDKPRLQLRLIADYIAGMTDRYAVDFYGRLHSDSPQSIFKSV
jgi:dGTPase